MQDNMENTEKKDTGYHLYGMHPVLEAVLSGRQIEKVLLKQGLEGQQFRQLLTELDSRGIPFQFVPAERLARFRGGKNQGVVAYLPQIDYIPLEEMVERAFQKDPAPIFVLLDGVSDVRGSRPQCRMCRSRRHHPSGEGRSRYQRRRGQGFGRCLAAHRGLKVQEPAYSDLLSEGERISDSGCN